MGGGGYFGYIKIKDYRKGLAEKERSAQALAIEQQKYLEEAKAEIEKLKMDSTESKEIQNSLQQQIKKSSEAKPAIQNYSILTTEISPYLSGVVEIVCKNARGSGSLYKMGSDYYVLTNGHVIDTPYYRTDDGVRVCYLFANDENDEFLGTYELHTDEARVWNNKSDVALLKIHTSGGDDSVPISSLNYSIFSIGTCSTKIMLNSPVVVIGYPAYSRSGNFSFRSITTGIISAKDSSTLLSGFSYDDYFVSAKIDSGNSGGIALSKDNDGLCVLGIPTWLSIGNYETQGIIQNIYNIYTKD